MVRFKEIRPPKRTPGICRFHPTMVRFKGAGAAAGGAVARVSIPLWCDLKKLTTPISLTVSMVSIPLWCDLKGELPYENIVVRYGFHPTMVRFKASRACLRRPRRPVSIPLWCDLKIGFFDGLLEWVKVSIPLWCDLKQHFNPPLRSPPCVSIPLWCDLKECRPVTPFILLFTFPSHYGAI